MRIGKAFKGKFAAVDTALSGKVNTNFSNAGKPYVTETYVNGKNWYRKWSDGWIEQSGYLGVGADNTVNFLKAFTTTNYNVQVTGADNATVGYIFVTMSRTQSSMHVQTAAGGATAAYISKFWYACGY